jgi:hypothetical protein
MSEKLTKKEAKELSLEVWRYLRDHPAISSKVHLPPAIRNKIIDFPYACPLCELFLERTKDVCPGCPLDIENCRGEESFYNQWYYAIEIEERREAASKIASIIEAWEPEEEK